MSEASSQQSTQPARSAIEALLVIINRGRDLLSRNDLSGGYVRVWSTYARTPIGQIFGIDSNVYKSWPVPQTSVANAQARKTLEERIARLECLIESVTKAAQSALTNNIGHRVFIGHGRSPVWRELKDFVFERLHLAWDEFNRESTAGVATTTRLETMLGEATFAFLIMTAEDEHADATLHARENVVHEVGLFQGKLGMERAIVSREEGCQVFSNIHGLTNIGFPKGNISSTFEEIRRVLEREKIITG